MVYGVILAGGIGKRMGSAIPKQYIEIEGKPIIIYTIERFFEFSSIDKIYVAVSQEWIPEFDKMLKKYFDQFEYEKINVVVGGKERIDTILNSKDAIVRDNGVSSNDIVIFHDAVRPFITEDVINDGINVARTHKAAVAAVKSVDTMLFSEDESLVEEILDRSKIYKGQAPDTFQLEYFIELGNRLTDEQKRNLTGTSQFCSFNNEKIYMSKGSELNFKITTPEDIERACEVVRGRVK